MSYELTTRTWLSVLRRTTGANEVSPRGMKTRELLYNQTSWEMDFPVVLLAERKLNFRFMFAEALWILSGWNSIHELTPYCEEIAKFSDDGQTLSGAYGIPLLQQWIPVHKELLTNTSTRQAVITIFRPIFGSKDVPCTVALQFLIRDKKLHLSVSMRSSDAWLGLPYDVFVFSMIGQMMLLDLNQYGGFEKCEIGRLIITAGSQHLYERNRPRAAECLSAPIDHNRIGKIRPISFYGLNTPDDLLEWLRDKRECPGIEL